MRLRRLLTLTLITNLITNTLLLTMVITVTVMWIKSTQPSEDPIEPAAMSLPHKVQQPTKTGDQRIPKGEEAPKKNTPEVKAQTADSREIHERLGIQPKVWERLSAREVVFTRKGTDREIAFRAYFLVRATPDKLFTLFTDYPKLPQLYEEVKKTVVLDRGQDFAVVYYRSKYLFFELTWVVKESFSADHRQICWELVHHPKYPSKLKRATGCWRFTPTGIDNMTLLSYENDFKLSLLPKALAQRFAQQNIPKMAANIRNALDRIR